MDFSIVVTQVMAICGLITGVAAVVALVANLIKKAKAPNDAQNERLKALEEIAERHEKLLENDLRRFEKAEQGTRILQKAILALLSHSIDGNNSEQMLKAKNDLQDYLIDK